MFAPSVRPRVGINLTSAVRPIRAGRGARLLASTVTAGLLLTGCTSDDGSTAGASEPMVEDGEQNPSEDGEEALGPQGPQDLVVGTGEDTYTVEEPSADVGFEPRAIFEGLVEMSADYEIVPLLAESWEFVEPNTWRFELREGVTFHNGDALGSDDVKYTLDRIAEAGGGPLRLGPDSTVVVDDTTVEVTPTVENRRLIEQLVHPTYGIVADGTAPGEEPVGTGPFRFVDYQPQERLVVERFDDYWGERALLETVTFQFIPEPNARRLALEAGDIDVMLDVPLDTATTLESSGFVVDRPASGLYEALYAKISEEGASTILMDENIRKAIGHSIDRQALIDGVFDGLAVDEQTMVPSRLLGDAAGIVRGYDFDLEAAAALLEKSGWMPGDDGIRVKNDERLVVRLVSGFPSDQAHGNVPEFLQAQLADVGIEVEILTAPDSETYRELLNAQNGDLYLERGNQNDANPAFLPGLLFWSEGLFGNIGYQPLFATRWPPDAPLRIGDGTFDETIVAALATPDPEEVKHLSAEAMSLLVDTHAIVLPLAGLIRPHAVRAGVEGLAAHPSGVQVQYDDAFIAG